MKMKIKWKLLVAILISIITCLMALYLNEIKHSDAIYTSLFYLPIIIVGLWYYRFVIPLAIIYSLQFCLLDYIDFGSLSIDQFIRSLIMITGSVIMYCLGQRLNKKNKELEIIGNIMTIEKERLRITLQSIGDGVISTDYNGNVTLLNEVAKNLTGWPDDTAVGRPFSEVFEIINEFTRKKSENIVKRVLENGKINELANHTVLISKDGIERPIEDSATPIVQENGKIVGVILVFRDISKKKQKLDEIEFLSYHDQLTGLYNRRFYETELKRLDTERNLPMTIVMGDFNGLKLINDSFGHAMGDELLRKAAEVIKKGCRADDIIVRLGGDEFVVILPKTDAFETEQIIKRIKDLSLKEKVGTIGISISFGYETKNNEEEKIQDIFKKAEDHMYKNKLFESPGIR